MSIDEIIEALEEYEETKEPNSKYKEIFKLEQMLLSENIPYQLRQNFDGWQIGYPELPPDDSCVCSVIQHFGSYGATEDLLEILGLTEDGSVEGYLSADEVFNRILRHYKGKQND